MTTSFMKTKQKLPVDLLDMRKKIVISFNRILVRICEIYIKLAVLSSKLYYHYTL